MNNSFKSALELEIKKEKSLLASYRKLQKKTFAEEKGYLQVQKRKDMRFFTYIRYENGKRIAEYLGSPNETDNPERIDKIRALKTAHFLRVAIPRLEQNLKSMERLLRVYEPADPNDIRDSMAAAYFNLPGELFRLANTIDHHKWAELTHQKQTSRGFQSHSPWIQGRTHIAADGNLFRSKSEVIIANSLFAHGIAYWYERALFIGEQWVSPDFTLLDKDGGIIIWEHFGLMGDDEYRKRYGEKMSLYARAGFYPGQNLITTFDDSDGNIDGRQIENFLLQFCL